MEADDVLLGRAEIERAFTALGERLVRRNVVADVFVVGGAAMALAYDATRVTRDVDATFVPHGIVLEEAQRIADDLGLPAGGRMSRRLSTFQGRRSRETPRVRSPRTEGDGGVYARTFIRTNLYRIDQE
jgi:hypothetical protein